VALKSKPPPAPEPALARPLRGYLYLTAAVTGAAVMVVEILGAKMLSPFLGLSHFVWTAQIAVTLVALACGYYAGGRLGGRQPGRLSRRAVCRTILHPSHLIIRIGSFPV